MIKNIMQIGFSMFMTISIISLTPVFLAGCRRTSISRELQKEEIRPILTRLTGRELPTKVENLRAIFHIEGDRERLEELYVAFRTDQKGCEYILDTFGGQNVQREEFPLDENNPFKWRMSDFLYACRLQKDLGVDLFDEELINRIERDAMVNTLRGHFPKDAVKYYFLGSSCSDLFYTVLIFKDMSIVYMFVSKPPSFIVP